MPGNSEWLSQDGSPGMALSCVCDIYPELYDLVPEGAESKNDGDDDDNDDYSILLMRKVRNRVVK